MTGGLSPKCLWLILTDGLSINIKSGLYSTEIVTRLYVGLSDLIPEPEERIKHVFKNQVYGFAPSKIIYNIAKRFIFGFAEMDQFAHLADKIDVSHFLCLDTVPYAMGDTEADLATMCTKSFGNAWGKKMKFDNIVGNPPYQKNDNGKRDDGKKNPSATNIFPNFVALAKKHSSVQSLIMPSKWTSGAGKGMTQFAQGMLKDRSIKGLVIYPRSKDVFPGNEIKGGVCYYVRDEEYDGLCSVTMSTKNGTETVQKFLKNPIAKVFVPFVALESILDKVNQVDPLHERSFQELVSVRKPYSLASDFLNDQHKYKLPQVSTEKENASDILIYGLKKGKRHIAYVSEAYPFSTSSHYNDTHKQEFHYSFPLWKVFIANANGSGTLGESFSQPIVGAPNSICTETFNRVGAFESQTEAQHLVKYIQTKLLRLLTGILKTTQHNPRRVWACVPLQDFSNNSDIDWSVSIAEIDQQLYRKYGFTAKEIQFIEKTTQPMNSQ